MTISEFFKEKYSARKDKDNMDTITMRIGRKMI